MNKLSHEQTFGQSCLLSSKRLGRLIEYLSAEAYRSASHDTSADTPTRIIFVHELKVPCYLKSNSKPGEDTTGEDYVSDLPKQIVATYNRLRLGNSKS